MPSIAILAEAEEKIRQDRDMLRRLRGKPLVPCLSHYIRSYSTLRDGTVIEHGSGLILSFIEAHEAAGAAYLSIPLGGEGTLAFSPPEFFATGVQAIDWVGRRFTLSGGPCSLTGASALP